MNSLVNAQFMFDANGQKGVIEDDNRRYI
jgi:hypothetical protein